MIDPIRTSPNALTGRPRHVAIIMDGNRRWARERSLRPLEGHRAGAQTLRAVVRAAAQAQLEILTVFAFSEENWGRDPGEVVALMELIRLFALRERESLLAENVRVRTIGRVERLPEPTKAALAELVAATARNDGLLLNIALNYGARTELCDAIRALAADVQRGALPLAALDEDVLPRYLYTAGLPDPDLLIRTGGELRVSNFLLYQIAYAELWSTTVHWPDFDAALLEQALGSFATRQRRFGT
ncbi:MAG: polyprenyl diphosphate synthase [Candidatus Baltobacteraceae bacterium]|jgi:undecaprenyl diphosphate synthase